LNNSFRSDLIKVVAAQLFFQIIVALLLHFYPKELDIEIIQAFNISAYVLISLLLLLSRRYMNANRDIVNILTFIFVYLSLSSLIMILISQEQYNKQFTTYLFYSIVFPLISSFFTNYLFFYALWPKGKINKLVLASAFVTIFIMVTVFYHVPFFADFMKHGEDYSLAVIFDVQINVYYVYIFNLMFLIFFWINYFQEQFALSDYLPAVLSIYLLMILNEIYQLYNLMHNLQNYIGAQYFNAIVNIGFIAILFIRLHYLTGPNRTEGENFVLN